MELCSFGREQDQKVPEAKISTKTILKKRNYGENLVLVESKRLYTQMENQF
jgi:hypothetical protein